MLRLKNMAAFPQPCLPDWEFDLTVAVEQHAFLLLFSYRAVEEFVAFEEDFDERRARGNRALDHGLGQRILDVALQCAAQGSGTVAAIPESLVEHPLLGF